MHDTIHERVISFTTVLEALSKENDCVNIYEYVFKQCFIKNWAFSELQALTLDVIGRTAFGIQPDAIHNRNDEFYVNARNFFNEFTLEKTSGLWLSRKKIHTEKNQLKSLGLFPVLGNMRHFSSLHKYNMVLARNLSSVVDYRIKNYDNFKKVDLIQLLLQQDKIRQIRENVGYFFDVIAQ